MSSTKIPYFNTPSTNNPPSLNTLYNQPIATSTGIVVADISPAITISPPSMEIDDTSTTIYTNTIIAGDLVVIGDLIVIGKIYQGYVYPIGADKVVKCIEYFESMYGLILNKDFYTTHNSIIVRMEDKDKFKSLILEVLI
jgi:hypothetical protein